MAFIKLSLEWGYGSINLTGTYIMYLTLKTMYYLTTGMSIYYTYLEGGGSMKNQENQEQPELDQEYNSKDSNYPARLSQEMFEKIHAFIALSNNHLMSIPVQGDQILVSAEIMNMANELHKALEELKNGNK